MNTPLKQLIWDLPTRLFHWTLATSVLLQYCTGLLGSDWLPVHAVLGYTTLSLLLFRFVWGFWGGYWSRFVNFIPTPTTLKAYLLSTEQPQNAQSLGHNPMGALSVLAMLLTLLAQAISGLMSSDDIAFNGPLTSHLSEQCVQWMSWYHTEIGFNLILALILLHLGAIVYYQRVRGQKLVQAMIHGYKEISHQSVKSAPCAATAPTQIKTAAPMTSHVASSTETLMEQNAEVKAVDAKKTSSNSLAQNARAMFVLVICGLVVYLLVNVAQV
jgi:cytochrome b